MQTTAALNTTASINANATVTLARPAAPQAARPARLLRTLARKWDMIAVLGLMASSAAYGVYALSHLAR